MKYKFTSFDVAEFWFGIDNMLSNVINAKFSSFYGLDWCGIHLKKKEMNFASQIKFTFIYNSIELFTKVNCNLKYFSSILNGIFDYRLFKWNASSENT